jgi:hypothetical protein
MQADSEFFVALLICLRIGVGSWEINVGQCGGTAVRETGDGAIGGGAG